MAASVFFGTRSTLISMTGKSESSHLSLKRLSGKLLSRSLDRVRQAELCSDKGRSLLRPPGFVLAIGFVGLVLGLFLGLAPMISASQGGPRRVLTERMAGRQF